jgi:hypothetical protein
MAHVLRDVIQDELRLVESREKKRPGVLAVVEGVFFVADEPSRNGRVYPRELWENVLSSPDLKRMLQNRLLFGTVGHVEEQLDDLIREGKVSHVVTELKLLPDGRGWGRAEILDTPVGRVLKTLLESGSKLSVSSKAYGEYDGQTGEGYWRVSPSNFLLERFDFVVDPGFLEAQPKVKEVYESVVRCQSDRDIVSKLIEEKGRLEKRIVELLREVEEKDRKLRRLEESVERFAGLRNGLLEREIEAIGDLVVERLGVKEEDISADTLLGVVRKIRKVLEERLGRYGRIRRMREDIELGMKRIDLVGDSDDEVVNGGVEEDELEFDLGCVCPFSDMRLHIERGLRRKLGKRVSVDNGDYYEENGEVFYAGDVVDEEGNVIGKVYVIGKYAGDGMDSSEVYLVSGILTLV